MKIIDTIIPFGSPDLQQPKELPISVIFEMDKKIIQLVGTDHTKDPLNPQIPVIENLVTEFTKGIDVKKTIVVIDGSYPVISEDMLKEDCIKNYGEQGYIGYFAKKSGIVFKSAEPSFDSIIQIVLNDLKLKPEYLAAWSFLNFLTYLIQQNNAFPKNSQEKIEIAINSFSKNYGLVGDTQSIYKGTVEIIKNETNIILPDHINNLVNLSITKEELRKAQEPNTNGASIQKIGAELNRARDYGIFKNIIKLQDDGYNNVFAVLGWNHVVAEAPAFRASGYNNL